MHLTTYSQYSSAGDVVDRFFSLSGNPSSCVWFGLLSVHCNEGNTLLAFSSVWRAIASLQFGRAAIASLQFGMAAIASLQFCRAAIASLQFGRACYC